MNKTSVSHIVGIIGSCDVFELPEEIGDGNHVDNHHYEEHDTGELTDVVGDRLQDAFQQRETCDEVYQMECQEQLVVRQTKHCEHDLPQLLLECPILKK